MRTGAAYIRVSTEEQMEYSPDSQLKKIQDYAISHEIELPEDLIFLDEGISGREASKRPAFMKMIGMAKVKPRPFDIILLWKFSRFARNRQDSILYKSMLRKECGIEVVSITEQLSDDPTSILIEAMLEAMDEYYSINLAQEVKRGMNEKFLRGGVVSIPPFGYRMGEGKFEVDREKAAVVRMMSADFLNGMPYRKIASKLNEMGIRTNRGNRFENRTVEYILSNPVYIGKFRRSTGEIKRKDRFYRGEQVVTVAARHEPILPEAVFHAVQKRMGDLKAQDLKKVIPQDRRSPSADYMLRGLVRCSVCGSTLTQAVRGKALQCHQYAKGKCSQSHYITLEKLNQAVLSRIETDIGEGDLEVDVVHGRETAAAKVSDILIEKEYRRLERVKEAYEAGIDSLEEYKRSKMAIAGRMKKLEENLPAAGSEEKKKEEHFRKPLKEVICRLQSSSVCETDKNEMLRSFISRIIFCRKDNTIQIYYYI